MKWINVKDKIPEVGKRVLVYQKGGVYGGYEIDIDYRTPEYYPESIEENNKIAWHDQCISNDIHWWMPLPKSPEEV